MLVHFKYYHLQYTYINYANCVNSKQPSFIDCHFIAFKGCIARSLLLLTVFSNKSYNKNVTTVVHIIKCTLDDVFSQNPIRVKYQHPQQEYSVLVFIKNVTISHIFSGSSILSFKNVNLTIEGMFIKNTYSLSTIAMISSLLTFHGYNEIFKNTMACFANAEMINLKENVILNFTLNNFYHAVFVSMPHYPVAYCPIQYISDRTNLDSVFLNKKKLNFSILFNHYHMHYLSNINPQSCTWSSASAFTQIRPFHVNQKLIHFTGTSTLTKRICLCSSNKTFYCTQEEIGPFFPGQHVSMNLLYRPTRRSTFNAAVLENVDATDSSPYACNTNSIQLQLTSNECTKITYLLTHRGEKWCILTLSVYPLPITGFLQWLEIYTVLLQHCPKGFSLHPQGYCQCDPILSLHIPSVTTCDIDHQTIPRPANTWISAYTINNSHSYHVSLHCPFDYCLPHSPQLNLSTPDSQCTSV